MSEHTLQLVARLEKRLLDPAVRRSRGELEPLIADDFVEIGRSGMVWHKQEIIAALVAAEPQHVEMDAGSASSIADGIVLYRYRSRRVGQDKLRETLRSSIWCLREGRWQIVFHQGTPVDDG